MPARLPPTMIDSMTVTPQNHGIIVYLGDGRTDMVLFAAIRLTSSTDECTGDAAATRNIYAAAPFRVLSPGAADPRA